MESEEERNSCFKGAYMFSERLDFLMQLADVQNNSLALAVSLDASYISRLRRGSRKLPENQTYVLPMSCYLARQIKHPHQREALREALELDIAWLDDERRPAAVLCAWLLGEEPSSGASGVSIFLRELASARLSLGKGTSKQASPRSFAPPACEKRNLYYGIDGKRAAVVRFLSTVRAHRTPQTLLLFSDEEMSWLFADPAFARQWADLLRDVLMAGNRIKIVHTVSRHIDEMMEAVAKWLPIYLTGAIEPLYYPGLRDGLFQRTMFIAPLSGAVIANSVNRDSSGMLNIYLEDQEAIRALTVEYNRYLACCNPLMKIFNATNIVRFWDEALSLGMIDAESIFLSPVPSFMTMPESVARSLAQRSGSAALFALWERCSGMVGALQQSFIEIVGPQTEKAIEAGVPVPLGEAFSVEGLRYTAEEYRSHLACARDLAVRYENYTVRMGSADEGSVAILGHKDAGVIVAKLNAPVTVFSLDEPGMTDAFWEHLSIRKARSNPLDL